MLTQHTIISRQSQFTKPSSTLLARTAESFPNTNCQSSWGWWDTFNAADLMEGKPDTGSSVAGAGSCNLAASTTVGSFTLSISGGKITFSFAASSADYQFGTLHIQAGCAPYRLPAHLVNSATHSATVLGGTGPDSGVSGTLTLSHSSGCALASQYTYFISHAAVAKKTPISQSCSTTASQ
jgi:hypothetical protein